MRLGVGLLLLVCACGKGPYGSFDAGHDVHVIVIPKPTPVKGIRVRPIVTIGPEVVRSPPRLIQGEAAPAAEVAILNVPTGRHRFSIWEPGQAVGARMDLKVEHETWVVLEMRPKERYGRLKVYDKPPVDKIGRYVQLVPVPD